MLFPGSTDIAASDAQTYIMPMLLGERIVMQWISKGYDDYVYVVRMFVLLHL